MESVLVCEFRKKFFFGKDFDAQLLGFGEFGARCFTDDDKIGFGGYAAGWHYRLGRARVARLPERENFCSSPVNTTVFPAKKLRTFVHRGFFF